MTDRDHLLEEIERFLDKTGMAASTFGRETVNDSSLMTRLRAGYDVRTRTADKCRTFMREYVKKSLAAA